MSAGRSIISINDTTKKWLFFDKSTAANAKVNDNTGILKSVSLITALFLIDPLSRVMELIQRKVPYLIAAISAGPTLLSEKYPPFYFDGLLQTGFYCLCWSCLAESRHVPLKPRTWCRSGSLCIPDLPGERDCACTSCWEMSVSLGWPVSVTSVLLGYGIGCRRKIRLVTTDNAETGELLSCAYH